MNAEKIANWIKVFSGICSIILWAYITFGIVDLLRSWSERVKTNPEFERSAEKESCPPNDCDACSKVEGK